MAKNLTIAQRTSLDRLIVGLEYVGYSSGNIRKNYRFEDWFEDDTPERVVDAVAFARKPFAYDTACFSVVASNGTDGVELIRKTRALGARRSFEVALDGRVTHWRVSHDPSECDRQEELAPGEVSKAFAKHQERWSPDAFLGLQHRTQARQADFVDAGLIPALEEQIRERVGPKLERILSEATTDYAKRHRAEPDLTVLFRLLFRGIAGKAMRDRQHPNFKGFNRGSDADELFSRVADHYGEPVGVGDRHTGRLIYDALWSGFNLRNISTDVLAFLYEDFLVTPELRERRGIHATAPSIARYVVSRMPLEEVGDDRTVVELCCGGAAFLVAALQEFRRLLPLDTPQADRHAYVQRRLFGVDVDAFAIEVARCSLTLSDYPNRNGWHLVQEDVFSDEGESPRMRAALSRAKIVLCNPPFEDFSKSDQSRYDVTTPRAPAELITRVLDLAPRDVCLGLVLPTQAVDGKSYANIREQLAERYETLELVHLPDDAFAKAELPTVLLIARNPNARRDAVTVTSGTIEDMRTFARAGVPKDKFAVTRTIQDVRRTLDATIFWEAWKHLGANGETHSLEPHRGVEWKSTFPKDLRTTDSPRGDEYRLGYHATGEISCYESPVPTHLNASEEGRDRNAWKLPWHLPKVLLNRVRNSRGPWRLAAFPAHKDMVCSENFIAIWPPHGWTARALAAVLNGPVASAYVATHDRVWDTKVSTLSRVPLPDLSKDQIAMLDSLVAKYQAQVKQYRRQLAEHNQQVKNKKGAGMFARDEATVAPPPDAHLRALILSIDETVIQGYDLPPPIERDIINHFRGSSRPIPFTFVEYESSLIRIRIAEQTRFLRESQGEQQATWDALNEMFVAERRAFRKPIP